MEVKKSDKANLEKRKALFVQIGLVITLSAMIFAFEYKTYDKKKQDKEEKEVVHQVEEFVMQTQQEDTPPPPEDAPPPETTEFEIVDDNIEITRAFDPTLLTGGGGNINPNIPTIDIHEEETLQEETTIFTVVEKEASYPGGVEALMKFLSENIKYPEQAKAAGTKGIVYLTFVVERDGRITDIKILRDIGSGCGEEAKRVVGMMKKWNPAEQRGKPVRQQFNLPVNFNLKG